MDTLPVEILVTVFKLISEIPSVLSDETYPPHEKNLAAVSLVCKLWKDGAFSTPQMWSLIEIGRSHDHYFRASRHVKRAGREPLNIIILNVPSRPTSGDWDLGLRLLKAQSYRWKSLYCNHLTEALIPEHCIPKHLPNLVYANIPSVWRYPQECILLDAPKLRCIATCDRSFGSRLTERTCHNVRVIQLTTDNDGPHTVLSGAWRFHQAYPALEAPELISPGDPNAYRFLVSDSRVNGFRTLLLTGWRADHLAYNITNKMSEYWTLIVVRTKSREFHFEPPELPCVLFHDMAFSDMYRIVMKTRLVNSCRIFVDEATSTKPAESDIVAYAAYLRQLDELQTKYRFEWASI